MAAGQFLQELPGDDLYGEHWRYRSCPMQFVTGTVSDWMDRRAYIARHPATAPAYDAVSARDRAFDKYYDYVLAEFRRMGREGNAWRGKPPI